MVEDYYPGSFTITVQDAETGDLVLDRFFNDTDHNRVDLSSEIPSNEPLMVTVKSNNETLWHEHVEPYEGYTLKISENGTVDTVLYES